MVDNSFLEMAKNAYAGEVSQAQILDQKATNQIGFASIITTIIGVMFGYGGFGIISQEINKSFPIIPPLLISALVLLLISIAIPIFVLSPFRKTRVIFDAESAYRECKKANATDAEIIEATFNAYTSMTNNILALNNRKSVQLYCGNMCALAGLVLSFISIIRLLP